jgi:hypothetical protein
MYAVTAVNLTISWTEYYTSNISLHHVMDSGSGELCYERFWVRLKKIIKMCVKIASHEHSKCKAGVLQFICYTTVIAVFFGAVF